MKSSFVSKCVSNAIQLAVTMSENVNGFLTGIYARSVTNVIHLITEYKWING